MNLTEFLTCATTRSGLPGNEQEVAAFMQEAFAPYCAQTRVDGLQNMIAHLPGAGGPKIYVCAHLDEIGLIVTDIEDDGCLRFSQMGGVDPRILPASEVTVLCDEPLHGVIGAKPPHILSEADRRKNYKREDLYIDVGYGAEEVRRRVSVGDRVQLSGKFTQLAGDYAASKTLDDRACCAVLWLCAMELQRMEHKADVYLVCSSQEEVGSRGAKTSVYAVDPDLAIAIDVTHADMPDCKADETHHIDKAAFTCGPNIHPKMLAEVLRVAKEINVETEVSACAGDTWTDAWELQVSRAGVPTVLMELPLKYMHTTVETISLRTLREQARLLAAYIAALDENWEDKICF